MPEFHFYYPIEVRYGDLDPQGHVNNARYLTYCEHARVSYVQHLGLWDGEASWMEFGFILAEASLSFLKPVKFGQGLRLGVCTTRLGNKSLTMEYLLEDTRNGEALCRGSSVMVAFDYRSGQSIPIPQSWRVVIREFEGMEESGTNRDTPKD
jgi:acyl-CoA thioester hydrolase